MRRASRACDTCRTKKIKCDSQTPACGNCRLYSSKCKYETPRRRRGPKSRHQYGSMLSSIDSTSRSTSIDTPDLGTLVPTDQPPDSLNVDFEVPADSSPAFSNDGSHRTRGDTCGQSVRHNLATSTSVSPQATLSDVGGRHHIPIEIQRALRLNIAARTSDTKRLLENCIDKFMQFKFPILPAIHFATLSRATSLLDDITDNSAVVNGQFSLDNMKLFTLLTAACATVCTLSQEPRILVSDETELAKEFLSASRQMLLCYLDSDMNKPDSSSLMIRILQSNTLHYLGKTQIALHLIRTSWSLALTLRLYDEESLVSTQPVEARIRRSIFWALYQADKSVSVLNDVPSLMGDLVLGQSITLARGSVSEDSESLLSGHDSWFGGSFETKIMVGFDLGTQLWAQGADILLDMKFVAHMRSKTESSGFPADDLPATAIMHAYMSFSEILDKMPSWIHRPEEHTAENSSATTKQQNAFQTQKTNLLITYHCLRLAIIRQAQKCRLCYLIGLTDNQIMLALRKLQIAGDLLAAAKSVDFESLQANGEPCVEKLRHAGVEVLGILHETTDTATSSRANALFSELINLIAALNSKISDELVGNLT